MNIFKIIDEIKQFDGDAIGRIEHATRRSFMTKFSRSLTAAAVPTVMASIVNKAYAQSAAAVDILNFALTLEYLEDEFIEWVTPLLVSSLPNTPWYSTRLASTKLST